MDTLFWKQLRPDIKVLNSKQMLYGKYPCKLVLICNGSSMLREPDLDFETQLLFMRRVNHGGSWKRTSPKVAPHELSLLHVLRDFRAELADQDDDEIKMRIEDPYIQIYSKTSESLEDAAARLFVGRTDADQFLDSVTLPKNQKELDLLHQGYVLKSHSDYPFKINFRDGKYSQEVRSSLLTYLDAQVPDISIPDNTRKQLEKVRGDFIWGGYFYCMDENIQIMLSMMHPRLVRSVERYHSKDK